MGALGQILELEGSRPLKKQRLTVVTRPWPQYMPPKPKPKPKTDDTNVLEIFGEMEFREGNSGTGTPTPIPSLFPASTPTPLLCSPDLNSGFDITKVQDVGESEGWENIGTCGRRTCLRCNNTVVGSRFLGASFPAPISSIGRNGKPKVYYQQIKEGGRFVLKEIKMLDQQCMHASRENGRLLLQLGNPSSPDDDA